MTTDQSTDRTIDLYVIVERLRSLGDYAYVEYTGGGVATIYASADEDPARPGLPAGNHVYACGIRGHYHDPGYQAIAGPGWFVGERFNTRNPEGLADGAYASLEDFYVGPDDQGDEMPYRATASDDEASIALRMHREILADRLADAFIADLRENLTPDQFEEVRRRNAEPEYARADAAHDFLDANECMTAAFEAILGREANPSDDDDTGLWNRAWDIARRRALVAPFPTLPDGDPSADDTLVNPQSRPGYEWHRGNRSVPAEPRIDWTSRRSLIAWLQWNDRNGCYTDSECASEGLGPIPLNDLRQLVIDQAAG